MLKTTSWHHDKSQVSVKGNIYRSYLNSSPPGQNGRHFTDDNLKCIIVNEKFCILIEISLKFVPKCPIDNKTVMVQVRAEQATSCYLNQCWRSSPTHICGTRGRWVNSHYNTRSTQKKPGSTAKCMVRHKKSRFDTKMPGSTQKWPSQHAPVDIAIIKHPPSPPVGNIFFQFYSNILFLRTNREMKMKLYWYELKISIFNIIMKIEM